MDMSKIVWKIYFLVVVFTVIILYHLQFYRTSIDLVMLVYGVMILSVVSYFIGFYQYRVGGFEL